ncbi:MAG: secretin N-terminal domain-containing protein [Thermoanaerobaculia bacterium]
MSRGNRAAAGLLFVLLWGGTAGCSTYRLAHQASLSEDSGDWDTAVQRYLQLVERQPSNVRFKTALLRARLKASQEHFAKGQRFRAAGVLERALIEFQEAVQLDSTNQYAQVELDQLRAEVAKADKSGAQITLDEMKKKTRDQPAQPPVLSPRSKEAISLDFPKPVSIFDIYRALGKAFGINVLFDPALKDQDLAIELRDVTAQNALETLMRAAGHFYKVVDEHSIIIAADNPQNRKNYEDLVIQTFFLSNAEVKDVLQLLRSLIGAKNIATDERLNAVTIRDTADKVKVAQRMIEGIDKSRAEVIVDVELIEVDTTRLRQLGVSLSANQITQGLDLGEDAKIHLNDLKYLNQSSWVLSIPSIIYDFVKTNSDAQLLAKPQIRISEGEKGKVHIGDRVPIPVTSFSAQQTSGGNIIPITSFQYQDVGIKIDIEPRVHHNKEVTLKLQIEVSQITGYQDGGGGQKQPIIGTRTIESTIRLKDGETNFLAGLIRTDETSGESGLPGLSDIPIIGRLFGRTTSDIKRSDVMLTLTPHIIRTPEITEADLMPIWVGTESNISFRGGTPRVESENEGPFDDGQSAAEADEKIREQVQRLPRGLRSEGVVPPGPASPTPFDSNPGALAPGSGPSNPFAPPPTKKEEPSDDNMSEKGSAPVEIPESIGTPLNLLATTQAASGVSGGSGNGRIRLLPQSLDVEPGDTFEIEVEIATTSPVAHVPMTLTWDADLLQLDKVLPGDFLGEGRSAEFSSDRSTPGTVILAANRAAGSAGVAGHGALARLRFRALGSGIANISVGEHRLLDAQMFEIGGVAASGSEVEVLSADSEPTIRETVQVPSSPPGGR